MGTAAKRLVKARRKKRHTAAALDALRTGRVTLEQTLEKPPPALARVSIHVVIEKSQGMGPVGTKTCLEKAHVWPTDALGSLTREQLQLVKKHLPPRARYRDVS